MRIVVIWAKGLPPGPPRSSFFGLRLTLTPRSSSSLYLTKAFHIQSRQPTTNHTQAITTCIAFLLLYNTRVPQAWLVARTRGWPSGISSASSLLSSPPLPSSSLMMRAPSSEPPPRPAGALDKARRSPAACDAGGGGWERAKEQPLWWTKWSGRDQTSQQGDEAMHHDGCFLPHTLIPSPPLSQPTQDFRRDRPCNSSVGLPFLPWVPSSVTPTPLPIEVKASQE